MGSQFYVIHQALKSPSIENKIAFEMIPPLKRAGKLLLIMYLIITPGL